MKPYLIIFFIGIISFQALSQRNLFSQRYQALSQDFNINEDQLNLYRQEGKLEIFNTEKHKTKLAKTILGLKKGRKKTIDLGYYKNQYKILSRATIPHYRVRYIFINTEKFDTAQELEAYISKVRELLKDNAFKSVAMQYSMDYKKHVGGDSGWFKEGKTNPKFFKEVSSSSRLAEEIFEFGIPENNAYYFVQKTHASKDIEEVLVLTKEK